MAHAQKTDFVFRRMGRVHLNRRGRQFSRLLAAEVCASAVVMLDTPCSEVVRRVLATHCIRQGKTFTSPPVRHRVQSHFNWTVPLAKAATRYNKTFDFGQLCNWSPCSVEHTPTEPANPYAIVHSHSPN